MIGAAALTPQVLFASHAWNGYHQGRTSNPFSIKVGNNLTTGAGQDAYMASMEDWSRSTALELMAPNLPSTAAGSNSTFALMRYIVASATRTLG